MIIHLFDAESRDVWAISVKTGMFTEPMIA